MALDGAFLHHIRKELTDAALEARVEKIYQPNQEEIVLLLRTYTDHFKLLLSARANSARIHFTRFVPENPPQPPMLCMLMRKRLQGARLSAVEQPGLERVLRLVFDAVNELGDHVALSLYVEIMGRYSNIIFVDENGKIIDALKRVDAEMTSERLVLPGLRYELPPPQDKLCALEVSPAEAADRIRSMPPAMPLSKAVLSSLQGVSPDCGARGGFSRRPRHGSGSGADGGGALAAPSVLPRSPVHHRPGGGRRAAHGREAGRQTARFHLFPH